MEIEPAAPRAVGLRAHVPLRALLAHAADDPAASALAREGGRAFVSPSLRPYLIAALADADAGRAGARRRRRRPQRARPRRRPAGLARAPRRSASTHRAASPTSRTSRRRRTSSACGSRRWTRSAMRGDEAPVVVVSAVALSREGPRPGAAPARLRARATATCVDLDELADDLVAAGYERVEQVDDRGQFAIRGGLLDLYPATEDRAVRVDLFGDEIESLRWFSTFTQRSLGEAERGRDRARPPSSPPSTASWPRSPRSRTPSERPDMAELLPVDRFRALLDLAPATAPRAGRRRGGRRARARRPLAGRHAPPSTTRTRTTSTSGPTTSPRRSTRAPASGSPRSTGDQPVEFRAQAADIAARSLREAEPELEKLVRSRLPHGRHLAAGAARASAPPTTSPASRPTGSSDARRDRPGRADASPRPRLRDGFIAAGASARGDPRAPARSAGAAPSAPRAAPRAGAPCAPSPTCAPATSSSTRTTASRASPASTPRPSRGVTRDYLDLEFAGHGPGLHARRPAREDLAATSAPAARTRRCPSSAARAGRRSRPAPGAPRRSSPASCSTCTPSASGAPGHALPGRHRLAARVRGGVPVHRDARPARRDRGGQGRHGGAAADGPADLRRRRLRQDRGGAARRVQGAPRTASRC